MPGEGFDTDTALAYGTLVHALLENLPRLHGSAHEAFFERAAARSGLPQDLTDTALVEATRVFGDPAFAHLFGPDSMAEVPISAQLGPDRMHGTIDRLIVSPDQVLAIDFKSNRTVPKGATDTPDALLRQLGAYAVGLAQIYPGRIIRTGILWTSRPCLIEVPHDIVTESLFDPRYLDAPRRRT